MKEKIEGVLLKRGYEVVDYSDVKASVDLIAKKGETVYILRLLGSLDALKPDHAQDMLNLARILRGTALVIAERSRQGALKRGVIYYRYGVPAISADTFLDILEGEMPKALYIKGREVVELDAERLRNRREKLGLSLQRLAELVGTTKESIYRYEHGHHATSEIAERLRRVLGEDLRKDIWPLHGTAAQRLHYPFTLIRGLGAEVGEFKRMPWEALGRGELIISFLRETRRKRLKRRIASIGRAKGSIINYFLLIGRKRRDVPYIEEEELIQAKSFREIEKIARERNEG